MGSSWRQFETFSILCHHIFVCYHMQHCLLFVGSFVSCEAVLVPAGYFSLNVPSGLTLYWFTNNLLTTGQQVKLLLSAV